MALDCRGAQGETVMSNQLSERLRRIIDRQLLVMRSSCRVYHSTSQSVPDATWKALSMDSERWDPSGMHDPVTNNSRITIQRAGEYLCGGSIVIASSAAGPRRIVAVWLNGVETGTSIATQEMHVGAAYAVQISCGTDYEFVEGDYIELGAFQNSGGPLNVAVVGNISPEFWCRQTR